MSTEHGSRGPNELRLALRAGVISIVASAAITLVKFLAWSLTGSTAVLSDAAESLVNVAAASMATWSVVVAARPADADHPYGHGKAESISAAVEGLMIAGAASLIFVVAVRALVVGPVIVRLDYGFVLSAATAGANLVLGLYLVRIGRRAGSAAIEADGQHVMTDVITTAGTIVALVAVKLTELAWIDPLVALAVAVLLMMLIAVGGEDGAGVAMVVVVLLAIAFAFVFAIVANMILVPFTLRAGLTQEFGKAFDVPFAKQFIANNSHQGINRHI